MCGQGFLIGTAWVQIVVIWMENLDNVGTWDGDMDHPRQVDGYSIQSRSIIFTNQQNRTH